MKASQRFDLSVDAKETRIRGREDKKDKPSQPELWYYVGLATELGFSIALPLVGGAFLGRYLDQVRDTYPKATLSLLSIGFLLSLVNFIRILQDIIKKEKK